MKRNNESRHTGPPTTRSDYYKEFSVCCPRCEKEALVTCKEIYDWNSGKLKCTSCLHTETAADNKRFKATVTCNCDNCGKRLKKEIFGLKKELETIAIPCPHCTIIRAFEPKHEEYRQRYPDTSSPSDPVFNLPFWFRTDVRGDLFWACNRQHLSDIKSYVNAKLRERSGAGYTTMVEKLPQFIKEAKNRALLIKLIEKLERK